MKFLWREKVYGWWSVTGLIGSNANWFFGFSRKPPSPAQPLPPTSDPRTSGVDVPEGGRR